jgi:hypothetical protein
MAKIKSGVTLSLKDLFSQGMSKAAGAASGFAGKTLGAIEKVDKTFSGTAAKLAAFGLTLSVGAAAKGVIEMDHRMTRLGLSANASAEQISKMKKAIFDVAQASDVKIDPTNILSGIEVIINKTNNLKYAEDNIRNIALAIQATGESGDLIGDIFSEFKNFEYTTEQISALMDDMVAQANQGAFSLGEFAKAAPQIFSTLNANKMGVMPENIKKINAALQIINAGVKNPQKAVAAFNSTMNELSDSEKQKNLRRLGIRVKDSAGNFRDFNDIMFEIAEKSKNTRNADYLNKIFSSSSMQAIRSYVSHGERMYENLTDLGDTTGLLQKQSAAMAGTLQSNIKNLQTAFNNFADSNLTKPLANLTELLNKLSEDPERLKKVFTGIAVGIGAIATVKGIAGISRLVGSLLQLKGGKINIAESLNMATAMPVYVTNWGGGPGIPGMGGNGQKAGAGSELYQQTQLAKGTPLTNAQNAVKNITPAQYGTAAAGAGVAAAFIKIPQMVNELDAIKQNEELTAKERGKAKGGAIGDASGSIVGAAAGGAAGVAAGAAVGAAVGSVVPVLGTAVGALVGAGIGALGMYLGGKAGRKIGEGIGESLATDESQAQQPSNRKYAWYDSPAERRYRQRYLRASDLPSQITQTGSSVTPQKVELGGQAVMDVNVNLSGISPTASVAIRDNSTNFRFNSGSAAQARMVP